ncbi:ABC transporter permease [Flexivirga endophytica]|uniref:ABC transporter permease n=1 Tax=Flexivirga endophytica TaxID=1849103 RepID=A0A916T7K0_9MICO|nr:polyketide antibiotic transporter [Flexivirga endophytica]GGB34721.1 ABC transporter permease [Flexivirga endophytica]GHB42638.1 ABC transporter permease [Flexivirga endophytica]
MNHNAGTATLLKVALRRDRAMVTVTLLLVTLLVASSDRATRDLYPHGATVPAGLVATMRNKAFVAIYGQLPHAASIDAMGVAKVLLPAGLAVAVLAQVIVRRHTRADEESGLAELIGGQVVGRHAALSAALVLAAGAVLAGAALSTIGLCLVGAPVGGALDFGLCVTVVGLTGAGIAAVSVQVVGSTRGAGQLGLGALGVLYLVRMIGDTTDPGLSWLSPVGWAEKSAPFAQNRWWIVIPGVVVFALFVQAAYLLLDRRDLGAGLVQSRRGRGRGRIHGAPGLTWRLLRGTVAGWLVCFGLLGIVVGSLTSTLTASADSAVQDMLRTLGGGQGSFINLYLATEISICALIATASGIAVTGHLAAEERAQRLDQLLATPLSRRRLLAPYVVGAVALPAGLMLVFAGLIGLADRVTASGTRLDMIALLRSAAVTFPAMWATIAVSVLILGIRAAWTPISWALLVLAGTVAQFGGLLSLPAWMRTWSPFDHLAAFPASRVDLATVTATTVVAALLTAAGSYLFMHRQID